MDWKSAIGLNNPPLFVSNVVGSCLWMGLAVLACITLSGEEAHRLNLLVVLLGTLLGWMTGILASPFGKVETLQFSTFSKILSAFLTGYAVSKIDRLFDQALTDHGPSAAFLARLALFSGSYVAVMLLVFLNRKHRL